MDRIIKTIAITYCIISSGILLYGAMPDSLEGILFTLVISLLMISPQYLLYRLFKRHGKKIFREIILFLQVIISAVGIWGYYDTSFVHIDAQGALIFIFLPIYQIMTIILAWLLLAIVNFFLKKSR